MYRIVQVIIHGGERWMAVRSPVNQLAAKIFKTHMVGSIVFE